MHELGHTRSNDGDGTISHLLTSEF
jgi:hypothetical protein